MVVARCGHMGWISFEMVSRGSKIGVRIEFQCNVLCG